MNKMFFVLYMLLLLMLLSSCEREEGLDLSGYTILENVPDEEGSYYCDLADNYTRYNSNSYVCWLFFAEDADGVSYLVENNMRRDFGVVVSHLEEGEYPITGNKYPMRDSVYVELEHKSFGAVTQGTVKVIESSPASYYHEIEYSFETVYKRKYYCLYKGFLPFDSSTGESNGELRDYIMYKYELGN